MAAPPRPPTPADLSAAFGTTAYCHPFRRYQRLALDTFEAARAAGQARLYLVLPPGAGKTVLGLEIARRLGRRTLVLTPNSAVQAQWLRQWQDFRPATAGASAESTLEAPITVLTYQALCTLDADQEGLEAAAVALWQRTLEQRDGLSTDQAEEAIARLHAAADERFADELARYRRRVRQVVAAGSSRQEVLELLHPNGQALVERAKAHGPLTLVLDECHHLLEMWGSLVRALVDELDADVLVVGLTATPPELLAGHEEAVYRDLFGRADLQVPTPAVVKEGHLAPYQELAYLVEPLEPERRFVAAQQERFQRLVSRVLDPEFASRSLVEWVQARVVERRAAGGAPVGWTSFERDEPALARAALRFLHAFQLDLPRGVRLHERHRQPLDAEDWVALLGDYCLRVLKSSPDPRDAAAWEEVRRALPSLGYVLTAQGVRAHTAPVDRVVALSGAKMLAATEILRTEHRALGDRLRALVVCDFERASPDSPVTLRGVLDPQAGSAALLLRTLADDPASAALDPLLVTARTVACARATLARLGPWLQAQEPALGGRLAADGLPSHGAAWEDLVVLAPATPWWEPRHYVPLLTRAFEEGVVRCVVGTRALLGEGWDAPRVNVLLDLTTAATGTAVHQIRGRSLRLDPAWPRKVADNWSVVCVAPEHPRGAQDYARFVRKHARTYAPTQEGEIESGVSHVHHALSPYGPPAAARFAEINEALLAHALDREAAYVRWRVGQPYENVETETLRVHFGRPLGVPGTRLLRHQRSPSSDDRLRRRVAAVGAAMLAAGACGALVLGPLGADPAVGLAVGSGAGGATGLGWLARWVRDPLVRLGPSDALEDLAAALAEALCEVGLLGRSLGAPAVRVVPQEDGAYRCFLAGADRTESAAFAEALDELLGPLDNPRYLIPRSVAPEPPRTAVGGLALALRWAITGRVSDRVVYHAVPAALAANKPRVLAFERAWRRYVSPGRALYAHDPRAQAILAVNRGASPFETTSELRTVWR